jgi:hypothetical protein
MGGDGPIDPSPTIDQAINGGFPWLEIECSRCKAKHDVDLAALPHVSTTSEHPPYCPFDRVDNRVAAEAPQLKEPHLLSVVLSETKR